MIEPASSSLDETREQLSRGAAFLRRALRFWPTSFAVIGLGAIACAVFLYVRTPSFRSETVILYSEGIRPSDDGDHQDAPPRSVAVRLKEILLSRASLDDVVRELDLYPDVRQTRGPVDAVEELKKHIEFRAPGGDTFSIAFTGTSPTQAQTVTARLADVVIREDSDLRKKQAVSLRDFLEREKQGTVTALHEAELALATFMAAHPRFALDASPLATGAAIRASMGIGAPIAQPARPHPMTRSRPEHGSTAIAPPPEPPPSARDAAQQGSLARAALAAARANLAELSARFTPAHPDVRAAQAEVERATSRLAAAEAAERASAPSTPSMMHLEPTSTASHASPGAPSSNADGNVVTLETQWVKLTRAATEARHHEDQVEAALFKAKSAADSEAGEQAVQVTLIDPAFVPQSPVPPGRVVIALMFAAASLALAAIAALVRALLDDRVYESRDLDPMTTLLAMVPRRAHG